jgi:predicted Zn-dependent protease
MIRYITSSIFIAICFVQSVSAQRLDEKTIQSIERAMTDEIKRNSADLRLNGLTDPFYISYTVTDNFRGEVTASFGAVTKSADSRIRQLNLRLLVGDYQLNDENFQDNSGAMFFGGGGAPIDMTLPLDDDYDGIRRGFWLATDNLFKDANETFTKKKAALERKQLSDEDKDLPDFAKAPVVTVTEPFIDIQFNKQESEDLARKLSAVFIRYPEIQSSLVTITYTNTASFFRSTEGTSYRKPQVNCEVVIQATAQALDDGEPLALMKTYNAVSLSALPLQTMLRDVESLASDLVALTKASKFSDKEYTGPVLFISDASTDFINDHIIAKLSAQREDVLGGNMMISITGKGASFQKKIGTRILPVSVTIKDNPLVKTRDGSSLLGYYPIDDEGVKPENMTIVDKGILKTLYMTRTPTKEVREPNGHARNTGSGTNPAPGIVEYIDTKGKPTIQMEKECYTRAKENGYSYAFIVSSVKKPTLLFTEGMGNIDDLLAGDKSLTPSLVYKVDIRSGKREPIRGIEMSLPTARDLRELTTSKETSIINTGLNGGGQGGFFSAGAKVPGTLIGPKAVLVTELEVRKKKTSAYPIKPVVSRPF